MKNKQRVYYFLKIYFIKFLQKIKYKKTNRQKLLKRKKGKCKRIKKNDNKRKTFKFFYTAANIKYINILI